MLNCITPLYPWQQQAVDKLSKLKVAALYMEQGTGKTRTALELIIKRLNNGKVEQVLWLCPCSVKSNLMEDIKKHLGYLPTCFKIIGIESLSSSDRLYLESHELISQKKTFLVVDESILVKNPKALRSQRIINIASQIQYKLILNGTPVTKNEADLFSQWYILDWRILGYRTYYSFAANHLEYYTITLPNGHKYVDKSRVKRVLEVDYLTRKIEPYTFQITKAECNFNLLPKQYHTQYYTLTDSQRVEYEQVKYDYLLAVNEFKSETIYKLFTALQHIVSGRRVLTGPDEVMRTESMFDNWRENPRMQALITLLTKIKDEKCIIFCKYNHEAEMIMQMLEIEYGKGCAVKFTGDVNQKNRQKNRIAFSKAAQFFVANRACGAFGLNLQFCHNVIYYSNDFDWGTRAQSEDRVHRLGQTKQVHIYDILASLTIDERIVNCLIKKENLVDNFKNELRNLIMNMIKYSVMSVQKNGAEFYSKLGYLFASKKIRKELGGYPLNNEDNWQWIVATKQDDVIGFIALEPKKKSIYIDSFYVFDKYRGKGIFQAMLDMALKLYDNDEITVSCQQTIKDVFEKNNFVQGGQKGHSWVNMRRKSNAEGV